ncbi:MAG: porin [Thiolinea sp.]
MKLKILTMAITVASLGAASFAAQAETSYYGSIRAGVSYEDDGVNDSTTTITDKYSRMGFKGETDLGNGMTGFGHYEFGVDLDTDKNSNGALSTRKAYAGVKGDFGRVRIGHDYHTFYNFAKGMTDVGWDYSCNGCQGPSRTGEALSYDTTIGAVKVGATAYLNDDVYGDGVELGASVDAGPATIYAAAADTDASGDTLYAVGAKGKFGAVGVGATYFDYGTDMSSYDVMFSYGDAYLLYGDGDQAADAGVTAGYSHSLGKKTTMWYEIHSRGDHKAASAIFKYDF